MRTTRFGFLSFFLALILATPVSCQDDFDAVTMKIKWQDHGLSETGRERLIKHLHDSFRDGSVPGGIVVIAHEGEVVLGETFGMRHIRDELPFELTTPFRAASISKSIMATLTMKMVDEGKIGLDDRLDRYLPAAAGLRVKGTNAPSRAPTIRECLHHTAGFIGDEEPTGRPWVRFRGKGKTLQQVVDYELTMPLMRQPGTGFMYSGIGYDMVGRVIEIVSDQKLDTVLQERLCKPLGMEHTTFHADAKSHPNMASFYWRWRSDGSLRRELNERTVPDGKYASVGGGIITTVVDLLKFMRMHRNGGQVDGRPWIRPEQLSQQYERVKPGAFYGLGFTLGPTIKPAPVANREEMHSGRRNEVTVAHSYSDPKPARISDNSKGPVLASWILHTGSSGTVFWWDRQTDTIGIVITQQRFSDGEPIAESKKQFAADAVAWPKELKTDYIDPIFGWRD